MKNIAFAFAVFGSSASANTCDETKNAILDANSAIGSAAQITEQIGMSAITGTFLIEGNAGEGFAKINDLNKEVLALQIEALEALLRAVTSLNC